uniref:Uncharacterized protein n=1 Tax=Globodera rostochiensis TaxID=31243 RepID=A0A914I956_GLORO
MALNRPPIAYVALKRINLTRRDIDVVKEVNILNTLTAVTWRRGLKMATLRSPFFGEKDNISSLMQKIRDAEYPPFPDRCYYTAQLELLVQLCLKPVYKERPSAVDVHRMSSNFCFIFRILCLPGKLNESFVRFLYRF